MKKSDFNFILPEALIARYPLLNRTDSKLLVGNPNTPSIQNSTFKALGEFLYPGDLLVFNDTKVIPARLYAVKPTGGKVEILIERLQDQHQALVHLGSNKPIKIGQLLLLPDNSTAIVIDKQNMLYRLQFEASQGSVLERLFKIGHMPLPNYLKRADEPEDSERYQTVYARLHGSVAAPTAGLHFDETLLAQLKARGILFAFVSLHVGAGTFMPVRVENIEEHQMHQEWMEISAETVKLITQVKQSGKKVVAVGTTSVRCLESAALALGQLQPTCGETNIFIRPGFDFKVVDALITNFHFPESTLLMLVSAFAGVSFIREVYQHAIDNAYRFYSYGDSSLLLRGPL